MVQGAWPGMTTYLVVQVVLLFGSETWNLTPALLTRVRGSTSNVHTGWYESISKHVAPGITGHTWFRLTF